MHRMCDLTKGETLVVIGVSHQDSRYGLVLKIKEFIKGTKILPQSVFRKSSKTIMRVSTFVLSAL